MNCINLMTCWIATKYNQPLMTRTDLKTGKNVSLLLFIRSKYDMRKIFDPDTEEHLVESRDTLLNEDVDESQELEVPDRNSLWEQSDFHLRQQILF